MDARTVFAWVLVAVLAAITWLVVRPFLSWLLATGVLAFVLFPLHVRLADRVGPRVSAGLLVLLVIVAVLAPLALGVNALLDRGIVVFEGLSRPELLRRLDRVVERSTGLNIPIQSYARAVADQFSAYVRDRASTILGASLHAFLGFLLLTFVLYYLLKDGRAFVHWLKQVTPLSPGVRDELFSSAGDMTWAVLKGHVLVAVVQGLVAGVSLFVTGVPQAALLTGAMMVLAVVPIVGVAPVLGGAVVYLFVNGRPLAAAFVVVWGMTSVAVTDDYLRAVVIDHESEMHSAVILVGVVGGTYLLGPMGLFVGPVLVGLFKTTVEVLGDHFEVTDFS